jgi:hypothetical protein
LRLSGRLVVDRGEVEVERLRHRAAGDRLNLVGERRERRPLAANVVRRVDDQLAGNAARARERIGDRGRRHCKQHDVRSGDIAAVPAELLHVVTCGPPQPGEPTANAASADDGDPHSQ